MVTGDGGKVSLSVVNSMQNKKGDGGGDGVREPLSVVIISCLSDSWHLLLTIFNHSSHSNTG